MPIPGVVDSLEAAPEALREHYVKGADGKFTLGVDGFVTAAEVAGLKQSQEKLLREKKALEGKVGNVDLDEYQRLKTEATERETKQAEAKGEWEKLKNAQAEAHKKELEVAGAKGAKYKSKLERNLVQRDAAVALAKFKGDPELLMPHIDAAVEVVEEEVDGELEHHVRIREKGGKKGHRIGKGGEYMTIEEYVAGELRERFPRAFDGSTAAGSGASGSDAARGNGKSLGRAEFDALSAEGKAAHLKDGGTVTD